MKSHRIIVPIGESVFVAVSLKGLDHDQLLADPCRTGGIPIVSAFHISTFCELAMESLQPTELDHIQAVIDAANCMLFASQTEPARTRKRPTEPQTPDSPLELSSSRPKLSSSRPVSNQIFNQMVSSGSVMSRQIQGDVKALRYFQYGMV